MRGLNLGNRLWHTDSSFKYLPARASLLYARSIAPIGGHTEFADLRAAYDALPDDMKRKLEGLVAEHALAYSRMRTGFTNFSESERKELPPVPQVMVRTIPENGRKSLYIASHIGHIFGMSDEECRALVDELIASCDAAPVRLYASMAPARSGDVGRSMHDASRHRVRRSALSSATCIARRFPTSPTPASRKASRFLPRRLKAARVRDPIRPPLASVRGSRGAHFPRSTIPKNSCTLRLKASGSSRFTACPVRGTIHKPALGIVRLRKMFASRHPRPRRRRPAEAEPSFWPDPPPNRRARDAAPGSCAA